MSDNNGNNSGDDPINHQVQVNVGPSESNMMSPRGSARHSGAYSGASASFASSSDAISEHHVAEVAKERIPPRRRIQSIVIPKKSIRGTRNMKEQDLASRARELMPALKWIPNYNIKKDFSADLITGLTVAIIIIPQSLSYGVRIALVCCLYFRSSKSQCERPI
jgi:hypothetical protein